MRKIGQMHGEAGRQHPLLEDPWADVFMLARACRLSPVEVLDWPLDVFVLYKAYCAGASRGEQIAAKKQRRRGG